MRLWRRSANTFGHTRARFTASGAASNTPIGLNKFAKPYRQIITYQGKDDGVNCPEVIYPKGREVAVTERHEAIAKAMYAVRPFVMASSATTFGTSVGHQFDWESAPGFYQHDFLDLAHAVIEYLDTQPQPHSSKGQYK